LSERVEATVSAFRFLDPSHGHPDARDTDRKIDKKDNAPTKPIDQAAIQHRPRSEGDASARSP
jgi:hypothetical protein